MKLSECELLPGKVLDNADPEKAGRVRVELPTLFSLDNMEIDNIPWISPLTMPGTQRFSLQPICSTVWVLINNANKGEYWYIPYFELNYDTKELSAVQNIDVLFNRTDDASMMYYDTAGGLTVKINDSLFNVNSNEKYIKGVAGESLLLINEDGVKIGKVPSNPAVKGNELISLLENLRNGINALLNKLQSPMHNYIYPEILQIRDTLENDMQNILSENVKID